MSLATKIHAEQARFAREQRRKTAGQLALDKAPQWKRKRPMMGTQK